MARLHTPRTTKITATQIFEGLKTNARDRRNLLFTTSLFSISQDRFLKSQTIVAVDDKSCQRYPKCMDSGQLAHHSLEITYWTIETLSGGCARSTCLDPTRGPRRPSRYTAGMPVDVDARVVSNIRLSDDYNVVCLDAPSLALVARPGQFVMIKPVAGFEPLLRRPFSIFEVLPTGNGAPTGFSLLNKRVGIGTEILYSVEVDQEIRCLGPLGVPFTVVAPPQEAWIVAGGVGLAPFLTLASALQQSGTPTTLFYGGRRSADLFYLDAFTQLGVELVLATEDGSRGESGLVTAPLERALTASVVSAKPTLYACGPTPMMRTVAGLAAAHGRPCQVSLEPVMGCGMGGCYSCVVPVCNSEDEPTHFVRACLKGPVFDSQTITWNRL